MNKNSSFNTKKSAAAVRTAASLRAAGNMRKTASGGISEASAHDFYSPVLSKDFLELPQNLKERRAWYRFFYQYNEIVRRSIDLHSELPLSKIRLQAPKCLDSDKSHYILSFFENMCDRIKLFKKLLSIAHEYYLIGTSYVFLEDGSEEGAKNDPLNKIEDLELPETAQNYRKKYDKMPNYQGWDRLTILPPDMVKVSKWQFSDKMQAQLIVPDTTKGFLANPASTMPGQDDKLHQSIIDDIPIEIKRKVDSGEPIIFDTDPYSGSHLVELNRKAGEYEEAGCSILDSCLRSLLLMDKYRQAQSQIASRHMTPMRVISAPKASYEDIMDLRDQVDSAIVDPDYSIIANYELTWNEMGSDTRILHLGDEYAELEKRLSAGLGVTLSLLTGEASYGGEKISLEIINTQYMLFREIIQDFVENHIFKPVALKKGFYEYDKYGNKVLLFPKLSFTRLAIRDNDAAFGQLFDLYQKGSIPLSYILDLLGIDANTTKEELERDVFTVNDSRFNDVLSALASPLAEQLINNTDLAKKISEYMKLKWQAPAAANPEEDRFK